MSALDDMTGPDRDVVARVAIVVLCEAGGVDDLDASDVARGAILDALRDRRLSVTIAGQVSRIVRATGAMELGAAARNGSLVVAPTRRAF